MKFIAIIDVVPGAPLENLKADLPNEVRESWKLFAAGALREAYATDAPTRVVFVLESADAASAATDLGKLPLIRAGLGLRTHRTPAIRKLVAVVCPLIAAALRRGMPQARAALDYCAT